MTGRLTAGGRDLRDEMALDKIRAAWGGLYDVGWADGAYHAVRVIGGPLLTAETVDGLDSVSRANFTRWVGAR